MVVTLFLLVTRLLPVPWPAACVLRPSLMRRRRVGKEDCSDEEVRRLAVLAGVTALILGVGAFALCACSRHWEIVFMPCVLVAAGVAVLYAAWRMGRF